MYEDGTCLFATSPKSPEVAKAGWFGTDVRTEREIEVEGPSLLIVRVLSVWQLSHIHIMYVFTLCHTCSHLRALTNQLTASSVCSHITFHQTNHSFDRGWHLPSSLEISQGMNQNTTKLDCKIFGKISKGHKQFKLKVGVKSLIYFNVTAIAMGVVPTATDLLYIWPWEKRIPSELSFIIRIM